ncbi:MAG: class I SAM-dependent methyltransferase [Chitinophagales bacterium]|nr:class I SAM-dependent methyltransferase [Chitinophagales bacterium]
MKQREKVVPLASGRVLEVAVGSGINLDLYNPSKVEKVWGLDPSDEMLEIAKKREDKHVPIEFIKASADKIPLESNSMDSVVITYALCTIPDVQSALAEIKRVLKPGGQLLFCEHGLAPDKSVIRTQNFINPVWSKLGGGCNLNRNIPTILNEGGYQITNLHTMYIPGWKPACFNYWGTAKIK